MNLSDAVKCLNADAADNPVLETIGVNEQTPVKSIAYDSRKVEKGGIFTAITGETLDGHQYAGQALENGACAVVAEKRLDLGGACALIVVKNSRRALAALAAEFFGHPSKRLKLIGVTGTNGKTTVTYYVETILKKAGLNPGVIGTVNARWKGRSQDSAVTTPESLELQETLARMVHDGVDCAAIEASSHALQQGRTDFCHFDVGVFTNLSQDHLDYHADMDAYFSAKQLLFTKCLVQSEKENKTAVINLDDPRGAQLCREIQIPVLCTGLADGAGIKACDLSADASGVGGRMETPAGDLIFQSGVVGRHNLYNLMSAAGVGISLGITPEVIEQGLCSTIDAPGRLEKVPNDLGRHVFVDYAHTPDALENVLRALKKISERRIITVLGCGGDRDKGKREKMGAAAAKYSDLIVITSDNPRSEEPLAIMEAVQKGVAKNGRPCLAVEDVAKGARRDGYAMEKDRRTAIQAAVSGSKAGDVVLIAGKGHETYQIVGDHRLHFDDRVEAAKALESLVKNTGGAE